MRYPVFTCNRCSFSAGIASLGAPHFYETALGRVPMLVQCGWCDGCATLVAIERLPAAEDLKKWEQTSALMQQTPAACADLGTHAERQESVAASPNGRELDFSHVLQVRTRLSQRSSPPRCLNCGSTKVAPVGDKLPRDLDLVGERAVPTALVHPRCGGLLQVHRPLLWVSIPWPPRIYDIDGNFLRTEHRQPIDRGIEHLDLTGADEDRDGTKCERET